MTVNREKIDKKAAKLSQIGKYEDAAEELQKIVRENPNDINTLNKIGDLYSRAGKIQEAVKNFQVIAQHYSKEGFYAKAIAVFKKVTKIDPKNNNVYFLLADLYIKEDLQNDARESLILAAQNYMDAGEKDRAKEAYEKILKLQPESIKVRIKLAEIYEKEKAFDKAVKEYEFIGSALLEKNLDKEAQSVFEKIMKIQTNNITAANSLVEIYTRTGSNHQAINLYNTLLKNDPNNVELLRAYGKTLYNMNEVRKAAEIIDRLLLKEPEDAEALSIMSKISLQESKLDNAFRYSLKVINIKFKSGPDNTTVDLLKPILEKDQYYLPALEKILDIYTTLSDINNTIASYERLGLAYKHHKLLEKALEAYNKVLDFNPENKKAQITISEIQKQITDQIPRSSEQAYVDSDIIAVAGIDLVAEDVEPKAAAPSAAGVKPEKPAAVPATSAPTAAEIEQLSNEQIYEIEILIKYGLLDKARDRLLNLVDRFPKNKEVRKLLRAIYQEKGDKVKAAMETLNLSGIYEFERNKVIAGKLKVEAVESLKMLYETGAELPAEALALIGEGAVAAGPAMVQKTLPVSESEIGSDKYIEVVDLDLVDLGSQDVDTSSVVIDDSDDAIAAVQEIGKSAVGLKSPVSSSRKDEARGVDATTFKIEPPGRIGEDIIEDSEILSKEKIKLTDFNKAADFTHSGPLAPKATGAAPESASAAAQTAMDFDIETIFKESTSAGVKKPEAYEIKKSIFDEGDSWDAELKIDDMFASIIAEETAMDQIALPVRDLAQPSKAPAFDEITDAEMESIFSQSQGIAQLPVQEQEDLASHIFAEKAVYDERTLMFELEEVDFYITNEFYEEAKAKLKELQYKYPEHSGVKDRVKMLAEKAAQSEIQKLHEDLFEPKDVHVDLLAAEMEKHEKAFESEIHQFFNEPFSSIRGLDKELEPIEKAAPIISDADIFKEEEEFFKITSEIEKEFSIPEPTTNINLEAQLESIFDEFREEMNETVSSEDYDTRYNLGIAYKEMVLLDEAIQEFQVAFKGTKHKVNAAAMLGYCFLEKEMPPQAIQWFRMALNNVRANAASQEVLGLKFALARAYMANDEKEGAAVILSEISQVAPDYPGLTDLVKELK